MKLIAGVEVRQNFEFLALLRIYEISSAVKKLVSDYTSRKKVGLVESVKRRWDTKRQNRFYETEIVKVLTKAKRPDKFRKYIPEFIEAAGLTGKGAKGEGADPSESILNMAIWLAVRLNKTPKQILTDVSHREAAALVGEIAKKRLLHLLDILQVQHSQPDKHFKELRKQYNQVRNNRIVLEKAKKKLISKKVVPIGSYRGIVNAMMQ